ncbi:MAG: hypothetical protein LBS03_07225, partial [Bacteroidales bacterium]|nr:hypothetical protein [Bacteroidales bacterium]
QQNTKTIAPIPDNHLLFSTIISIYIFNTKLRKIWNMLQKQLKIFTAVFHSIVKDIKKERAGINARLFPNKPNNYQLN